MAHEDRKRNTNVDLEDVFASFEEDLHVYSALAFEYIMKNLKKKLDPLVQRCFKDALLAPAGSERYQASCLHLFLRLPDVCVCSVLQDGKTGALATVFGILLDYVKLVQEHGTFPTVIAHFYKRIFHYVTVRPFSIVLGLLRVSFDAVA